MDPILQLMTAVVSSTASLALVFGGLAGWFVRRLDRRFDAIDRRFDTIDRRFEAVDGRFDTIDGRFDTIDRRFDTIDRRFEAVDGRFDTIDRRFDTIDRRFEAVDGRFDTIDRRFDTIDRRFEAVDGRFEAAAGDTRRQHEELKSDMRRQLEIARGERARLAIQMDHLGGRLEGLGDQLGDVRQCVGRLEGAMFGAFEPQQPPGQTA